MSVHSHQPPVSLCAMRMVPYHDHPLEALLSGHGGRRGDLLSLAASAAKASVVFFTFSTVKTVLDHSGYRFPVNLLHDVFPNNAAYHDVHHDPRGFRKNYSQPCFLACWDKLLGGVDPSELKPLGLKQGDGQHQSPNNNRDTPQQQQRQQEHQQGRQQKKDL